MTTQYWTVCLEIRFDESAAARAAVIEEVRAATSAYDRSVGGVQPGQVYGEILIGPTLSKDGVAEYVRARLEQALTAAGIPRAAVTVAEIRPR